MIKENEKMIFHIYTDGACHNVKGKQGSWGYVILNDSKSRIIHENFGYSEQTTNNRMELQAVISSIKHLLSLCQKNNVKISEIETHVYSDSKYVIDGINKWIKNWQKDSFLKVKNPDLWQDLNDAKKSAGRITFHWLRGHNGNKWNEYADKLCTTCLFSYTGVEPYDWKSNKGFAGRKYY